MNNPELYQSTNTLPKRDARQCLEENANKIKWKNDGGIVIDVGCGDGGVTTSILKTFIPTNYKSLVGCDISENMLQYANTHHATDSVSFTKLDIEGDLPDQLREKFDHAFSFYALNWINHQERAFTNIYDLLMKGGDCLLLFIGQLPVFDIYRELAQRPRWNYWLKDFNRYVSPYHDCQDPEKDIKRMMTIIGFTNVEVKYVEKSIAYTDVEAFKKAMKAINPFNIPLEMDDIFWQEYMNVFRKLQLVDHIEDDELNVRMDYKSIIVYATK